MNNKLVALILAIDENNWLWKENTLAWKIKADMSYFKEITTWTISPERQNAVVMGRKTWESIPEKFRPLHHRRNYIITRDENFQGWDGHFNNLDSCLDTLISDPSIESIYIIGGSQIYNEAINKDVADSIYLTQIFWTFDCDVFFTWVPDNYSLDIIGEKQEENGIFFKFLVYKKDHNKKTLTSGKTLWETPAPSVSRVEDDFF